MRPRFAESPHHPMDKLSPFVAFVALAFSSVVVAQEAPAPAAAPTEARGGLELQTSHFKNVAARGKKVYYTQKFDLSGLPSYKPETQVSGVIREWGSNYFADSPLGKYWEEGFRKFQPDVTFDYHLKTTLTATPALCMGLADLAPSRHITFDELLGFERVMNHEPVEVTVVTGSYNVPGWNYSIGIFVNKNNPLAHLTMKQLDGIFGAERTGAYHGTTWHLEDARGPEGNIRTWGQLGVTGEWAEKPIHVYGYNLRYHIPLTFERLVFNGADKWNEGLKEFANYRDAKGVSHLEAQQVIDAINDDPYGIGYSSVAYATDQTKCLPIAAKDGGDYVPMTIEHVQDRTYPLDDEVYFYLDRNPGKPVDPKVREFVRYILSREGQGEVQRDGHYLPLTAALVQEQLAKIQ